MGSHRRTIAAAVAVILASVSLYPIFIGTQWFWAGVGAVLAVAIAGTLTRLRRLPSAVCMIGELAGLTLYLNVAFESAKSKYGLVPTPTSLGRLWDLAGAGFRESAKYAPPVPELPGMVLLAAAGIGLTAILTDLIGVRLENAALAGLPLLLLFTEPFTLSVSRGALGTTIAFCLGTGGYLALLSSEGKDRIREWERPDPRPNEIPDTRALAITGRRVGIAAAAVALFLPVFVPGLHTTRLFGGQPGIGGTGGVASAGFPSPDTQLSNELRQARATQVLTYTSSDANPGYFQIYVLDNLTDSGWRMFSQPESLVPASKGLPLPPGLTTSEGSAAETTFVTVSPEVPQDALAALPVPYPATKVQAPGTLQADKNTLMLFDNGVQLGGLRYTVRSLDQSPAAADLNKVQPTRSGIAGSYLAVPQSYDVLRRIAAAQVAKAAAVTPFEKAVAIQNWLASGAFTYTLKAPTVTDEKSLETFLTKTRQGYCQQFSFAMAVLARLLGIPSRVAYGFTTGSPGAYGTWRVTTHDAHSWPELYFQGFGWLRFEPTPQGLRGQGTAYSPTYTQAAGNLGRSNAGSAVPTPAPSASDGITGQAAQNALRYKLGLPIGADSGGLGGGSSSDKLTAWDVFLLSMLALLCLLALVAVTPALARALIRRGRWRAGERGGNAGLAHAAWCELRDDLVDYRAGYQPSESPRALAARVGEGLELTGPALAALRRIAMAEERARYASRPDGGAGLRHDSAVVRRAIAAAATRRTRWLARLAPSSVIGSAAIRFAQAVDFTGRLNPEDWFGRTRLGRTRFGRARSGTASLAGEGATHRSEPPVAAGTLER